MPASDTRKQKHATLIALVGAAVALGAIDVMLAAPSSADGARLAITLLGNVAMMILGFRWLQIDARELDIRRPIWLNVGIILLALVFVPYYFYKTRPAGHRMPVIGGFFGLIFACMLASAFGATAMSLISGVSPAP